MRMSQLISQLTTTWKDEGKGGRSSSSSYSSLVIQSQRQRRRRRRRQQLQPITTFHHGHGFMFLLLTLLLFNPSTYIIPVQSFPSYLLQQCYLDMTTDEVIMNNQVVSADSSLYPTIHLVPYSISNEQNDEVKADNSGEIMITTQQLQQEEEITFKLKLQGIPKELHDVQYAVEVRYDLTFFSNSKSKQSDSFILAKFTSSGSGCNGRRAFSKAARNDRGVILTVYPQQIFDLFKQQQQQHESGGGGGGDGGGNNNTNKEKDVTIVVWAGWATGHSAVTLTPELKFRVVSSSPSSLSGGGNNSDIGKNVGKIGNQGNVGAAGGHAVDGNHIQDKAAGVENSNGKMHPTEKIKEGGGGDAAAPAPDGGNNQGKIGKGGNEPHESDFNAVKGKEEKEKLVVDNKQPSKGMRVKKIKGDSKLQEEKEKGIIDDLDHLPESQEEEEEGGKEQGKSKSIQDEINKKEYLARQQALAMEKMELMRKNIARHGWNEEEIRKNQMGGGGGQKKKEKKDKDGPKERGEKKYMDKTEVRMDKKTKDEHIKKDEESSHKTQRRKWHKLHERYDDNHELTLLGGDTSMIHWLRHFRKQYDKDTVSLDTTRYTYAVCGMILTMLGLLRYWKVMNRRLNKGRRDL